MVAYQTIQFYQGSVLSIISVLVYGFLGLFLAPTVFYRLQWVIEWPLRSRLGSS